MNTKRNYFSQRIILRKSLPRPWSTRELSKLWLLLICYMCFGCMQKINWFMGWVPQGFYGGIAVMGKPVFCFRFWFCKICLKNWNLRLRTKTNQVLDLLMFSDLPLPLEILSTNMTLPTWFMWLSIWKDIYGNALWNVWNIFF